MKQSTIFLDELNAKRAENFFDIYQSQHVINMPVRKTYLGNKEPRKCRFCYKTSNQVSFSKDAHVIPQFMGNKHLLSYFECNKCNERFSEYENSFANFVGASRTISQIKGKSGVPKHKDPKTGLEIELGENGLMIAIQHDSDEVVINEETKTLEIKTKRQPYIPLHLPKTLLKIGFCLLPVDELSDYDRARKVLLNDKKDKLLEGFDMLRIMGYFVPGIPLFQKPSAILFDKKPEHSKILVPQKQLVVYYSHYVYQMCMPFGDKDLKLQGQKIDVPVFPLLVDDRYFNKDRKYQQLNLKPTSVEKKRDEEHNMAFTFQDIKKNV